MALAAGWLAFLNARVVIATGSTAIAFEAAAFGMAGAAIALVAARASWRRRGQRRVADPRPTAEPVARPPVSATGADDDPLAKYRRWKLR